MSHFSGYAKIPSFTYQQFDRSSVKYTNIPLRLQPKPEKTSGTDGPGTDGKEESEKPVEVEDAGKDADSAETESYESTGKESGSADIANEGETSTQDIADPESNNEGIADTVKVTSGDTVGESNSNRPQEGDSDLQAGSGNADISPPNSEEQEVAGPPSTDNKDAVEIENASIEPLQEEDIVAAPTETSNGPKIDDTAPEDEVAANPDTSSATDPPVGEKTPGLGGSLATVPVEPTEPEPSEGEVPPPAPDPPQIQCDPFESTETNQVPQEAVASEGTKQSKNLKSKGKSVTVVEPKRAALKSSGKSNTKSSKSSKSKNSKSKSKSKPEKKRADKKSNATTKSEPASIAEDAMSTDHETKDLTAEINTPIVDESRTSADEPQASTKEDLPPPGNGTGELCEGKVVVDTATNTSAHTDGLEGSSGETDTANSANLEDAQAKKLIESGVSTDAAPSEPAGSTFAGEVSANPEKIEGDDVDEKTTLEIAQVNAEANAKDLEEGSNEPSAEKINVPTETPKFDDLIQDPTAEPNPDITTKAGEITTEEVGVLSERRPDEGEDENLEAGKQTEAEPTDIPRESTEGKAKDEIIAADGENAGTAGLAANEKSEEPIVEAADQPTQPNEVEEDGTSKDLEPDNKMLSEKEAQNSDKIDAETSEQQQDNEATNGSENQAKSDESKDGNVALDSGTNSDGTEDNLHMSGAEVQAAVANQHDVASKLSSPPSNQALAPEEEALDRARSRRSDDNTVLDENLDSGAEAKESLDLNPNRAWMEKGEDTIGSDQVTTAPSNNTAIPSVEEAVESANKESIYEEDTEASAYKEPLSSTNDGSPLVTIPTAELALSDECAAPMKSESLPMSDATEEIVNTEFMGEPSQDRGSVAPTDEVYRVVKDVADMPTLDKGSGSGTNDPIPDSLSLEANITLDSPQNEMAGDKDHLTQAPEKDTDGDLRENEGDFVGKSEAKEILSAQEEDSCANHELKLCKDANSTAEQPNVCTSEVLVNTTAPNTTHDKAEPTESPKAPQSSGSEEILENIVLEVDTKEAKLDQVPIQISEQAQKQSKDLEAQSGEESKESLPQHLQEHPNKPDQEDIEEQPKKDPKEEPEGSKKELKEEPEEKLEEESKEEVKEEPKEEHEDELKKVFEVESKEEIREEFKEEIEEEPKEESKEESKGESKEEPKESKDEEESKEEPKKESEEPKEERKEEPKEEPKEEAKEEAKEESMEELKKEPKESKEELKSAPQDPQEELRKQVEDQPHEQVKLEPREPPEEQPGEQSQEQTQEKPPEKPQEQLEKQSSNEVEVVEQSEKIVEEHTKEPPPEQIFQPLPVIKVDESDDKISDDHIISKEQTVTVEEQANINKETSKVDPVVAGVANPPASPVPESPRKRRQRSGWERERRNSKSSSLTGGNIISPKPESDPHHRRRRNVARKDSQPSRQSRRRSPILTDEKPEPKIEHSGKLHTKDREEKMQQPSRRRKNSGATEKGKSSASNRPKLLDGKKAESDAKVTLWGLNKSAEQNKSRRSNTLKTQEQSKSEDEEARKKRRQEKQKSKGPRELEAQSAQQGEPDDQAPDSKIAKKRDETKEDAGRVEDKGKRKDRDKIRGEEAEKSRQRRERSRREEPLMESPESIEPNGHGAAEPKINETHAADEAEAKPRDNKRHRHHRHHHHHQKRHKEELREEPRSPSKSGGLFSGLKRIFAK